MTDAVETVEGSVTPAKIIRGAGLERNFGLIGIVTFGLASIGISVSGLFPFSTIAGLFPGASLIAILTIAVIASLVHVYSYSMIAVAAPRSGADYVFATRVLPAPLGFASSWLFVLYSALMAGTLVAFFPKVVLPIFLTAFSMISGNSQAAGIARDVTQTSGTILAGSLFAVVAFSSMLMNPRRLQKILLGGVVLGLVAWIVMVVIFAFTQGAGQFESAWDNMMGGTAFRTQIDLARELGMPLSKGFMPMITAGFLMGFWVFFGYFVSTFLAGEIKSPEKNILRGSAISLVVTWLVLIVASFFVLKIITPEWLAAESFLFL
ncbi:MAG: amino acid permease, partial [Anaerolineaceae bacterium]|nr:amino acid permease [Anaerolineaceae bacterium]